MSLSISKHVADTDNGVASLGALLRALMERLLDGRDVLVGHVVTSSGVLEHAAQFCIFIIDGVVARLHVSNNSSVLSSTSGLFLVQIVELGFGSDSLTVVDGRVTNDEVDVILTLHALAVDEQMELTHTRDDDLLTLLILLHHKSGVFSLETLE